MLSLLSSCSEALVRSHLKTVYVYLTMSVLSATAGAYLHMVNGLFWNFGLLGALASMGLVMGLHFTPDNGKNRGQRTAMLLGFAFLSGACMSSDYSEYNSLFIFQFKYLSLLSHVNFITGRTPTKYIYKYHCICCRYHFAYEKGSPLPNPK